MSSYMRTTYEDHLIVLHNIYDNKHRIRTSDVLPLVNVVKHLTKLSKSDRHKVINHIMKDKE